MSNFMGKNGFQWFVGVVEDRADPKTLGRLRVRCLGYHTEDLIKLPTKDLPWAHVMSTITSAAVSGVGQTPLGAVEGTWVVGFFQDGTAGQQPVIIGTLPGVPGSLPVKIEKGDDDRYPGKGFQDYIHANYPKYTETDVNRLAVNDEDNPHSALTIRKADREISIGKADFDGQDLMAGSVSMSADLGGNWSEPEVPYNSSYPYNHVQETESGHIRELDDTHGAERIHERHTSGSGYEIGPEGTKVTRVKKDNYDIITGDDYVHINGAHSTTIEDGLRVFVNASASSDSHYTIEVGNNANVNIQVNKGDVNVVTKEGNINMKSGRSVRIDAEQEIRLKARSFKAEIDTTWDELVQGVNTKTGKTIDLN